MLLTVNGLITRSYDTGNRDRVLHIITEEAGRLSVLCKGGGSHKTGSAASVTQLYTWGNYEIYRGRSDDLYWFRSGSINRQFFSVTGDLSRMALAAYLCDLASELTDENSPVPETATLLRMMLNTLYVLSERDTPCSLVKGTVELRAAALMGYQPDLTACRTCHEVYPETAYFDVHNACFVCERCQAEANRRLGTLRADRPDEDDWRHSRLILPLSAGTLAAMRYALVAPDRRIFSCKIADPADARAFEHAAETYLLAQLDHTFDTLKFYREVAD